MRSPTRRLATLAMACAVPVCSAEEMVAGLTAIEYRPVARSTLVSKRGPALVVASVRQGAQLITVLARERGAAAPQPVARIVQVQRGPTLHIAIERLPESAAAVDADAEQTAIEQLYALVLQLEPDARYCLGSAMHCDPAGNTHADVLRALADARGDPAGHRAAAVAWRTVELSSAPTRSADADVVGVRASMQQAPLAGLAVHFNRAPHSLCVARTDAQGVAVCRLEDQHGDGHLHDHAAAVVATFPGDVRAEQVLLPTTHVLPAVVVPPSFAPRIRGMAPEKP